MIGDDETAFQPYYHCPNAEMGWQDGYYLPTEFGEGAANTDFNSMSWTYGQEEAWSNQMLFYSHACDLEPIELNCEHAEASDDTLDANLDSKLDEMPRKVVPQSSSAPWLSLECLLQDDASLEATRICAESIAATALDDEVLSAPIILPLNELMHTDGLVEGKPGPLLPLKILRWDGQDAAEEQTGLGRGVEFPPGLEPPAESPSHGSILHGSGICKPCAWFWKQGGCQNGAECGHCHLCPEGAIKARKKTKMAIMRLGLATPKAEVTDVVTGFSFTSKEEAWCRLSTTTCPGSETDSHSLGSDQETAKKSTLLAQEQPVKVFERSSKGSSEHGNGKCRPCAWFWKSTGCSNSANCSYCHLCPDGELKQRKKSKITLLRLGLSTPKADTAGFDQDAFGE